MADVCSKETKCVLINNEYIIIQSTLLCLVQCTVLSSVQFCNIYGKILKFSHHEHMESFMKLKPLDTQLLTCYPAVNFTNRAGRVLTKTELLISLTNLRSAERRVGKEGLRLG